MKIFLMTGPSGAGKTTASYVFEEAGYYIFDNIVSSAILPTLTELTVGDRHANKILFIVRPRFFSMCLDVLHEYSKTTGAIFKSIVIDCDVKTLTKRFKLTRHVHPMTAIYNIPLETALIEDKKFVSLASTLADVCIDTSNLDIKMFKSALLKLVFEDDKGVVSVRFISFGQKYGKPLDVDLVLDTRALPNPYWVKSMKDHSGMDNDVIEYLNSFKETKELLNKMINFLEYYLELVQKDGRGVYTIGVCCSGGRHRSVYFAESLCKYFSTKYRTSLIHRDIDKIG